MAAFRSLKIRIALTVFLLEAVMIVAALWQTSAAQTTALIQQQRAAQDAILELAARVSRTALLTDELSELRVYFEALQRDPAIERVLLGNARGTVVASADVAMLGQPLPPPADGPASQWRSVPIDNATGRLGLLLVQFSSGQVLKAQADARRLGFSIAAAGMAVIALVGYGLGLLLTRQLDRLGDAARRMADGDRQVRARLSGRDEVAAVGAAFDAMADAVAANDAALREQRETTALLLNSAAEAIYGIDLDGRCTFANPACVRLLGMAAESDLIGRDMPALTRGAPADAELLAAIREGRPLHRDGEMHRRSDGVDFPVEWWLHPVRRDTQLIGAVVTFVDVSERKLAERALVEERNFTSAVLSNAGALVLVLDRDGRIRRFNRAAERVSGRRFEEVEGRFAWEVVLPPDVADEVRREAFERLRDDPSRSSGGYVNEWHAADGSRRWIEWSNTVLRDAAGRAQYVVAVGIDVTDRRIADERIRVALHEKELLLKEIYHRVKNNLQMVVSLLTLQARNTGQPVAREALTDSARRIGSMALVHEQLYQSGDLSVIAFGPYLTQLLHAIESSLADGARRIALTAEIEPVDLGIETAVPLGLIVNELVCNAFKHAFPDGRPGTVTLSLTRRDDALRLEVRDNGAGLPEGFDPAASRSLGLRLVGMLSEQLGAELQHAGPPGGGSRFTLRFVPEMPERHRLPAGGPPAAPGRHPTTRAA